MPDGFLQVLVIDEGQMKGNVFFY